MKNKIFVYPSVFLLSAVVICFEIISTRISSVIFVNDYAFIILSFALLGLGSGSIYSYYRISVPGTAEQTGLISRTLAFMGASISLFILSVIMFSITLPFIYFLLLFIPFFLAGVVYSLLYRVYAENSFRVYAVDVSGGAVGSVLSLGLLTVVGAPNSLFFLSVIIFAAALIFGKDRIGKKGMRAGYSVLSIVLIALSLNGKADLAGKVPIGDYPEKDYYHVYPDIDFQPQIIDSRWSISGRSDLVRYSHQDMVQQLFIDGAAGRKYSSACSVPSVKLRR